MDALRKNSPCVIGLALAVALGIGLIPSCGSHHNGGKGGEPSDDDTGDDDLIDDDSQDGDDDDECKDNVAPDLLGVLYSVNGVREDPPITIYPEDAFGIYFEYADEDCNLAGGEFWLNYDESGFKALDQRLPDDLGCSSATSHLCWGFQPKEPLGLGAHTFAVYWTDICGAPSNTLEGGFAVADP